MCKIQFRENGEENHNITFLPVDVFIFIFIFDMIISQKNFSEIFYPPSHTRLWIKSLFFVTGLKGVAPHFFFYSWTCRTIESTLRSINFFIYSHCFPYGSRFFLLKCHTHTQKKYYRIHWSFYCSPPMRMLCNNFGYTLKKSLKKHEGKHTLPRA